MSSDAIFLQIEDGEMLRAPLSGYLTEDLLQSLIARYPELLAADQINEEDPPRWLLVSREARVPDAIDGNSRWSVDHLLIDHRAIPTFVEVKRSSDTRIRREMVGQMLDYAANATTYWPVDRIRTLAATQLGGAEALDRRLGELLALDCEDSAATIETYWRTLNENLRTGRIRLLFAADELPRELRRIIEFLNEHMPTIEVSGVELRRYKGAGVHALVPRVIGQTERARAERVGEVAKKKTSAAEFLSGLEPTVSEFFQGVFATASTEGLASMWGQKSFRIRTRQPSGKQITIFYAYPPGAVGRTEPWVEIYLKEVADDDATKLLRDALLSINGFRAAGDYTISLVVVPATLTAAKSAMPLIWEAYRRMRAD